MKKLEQKDITGYLPYGLYVMEGNKIRKVVGIYHGSYDFEEGYSSPENGDITKSKPILRPMSDLTKEIKQADYNDGEPFVPIVELAKIGRPRGNWKLGDGEAVDLTAHFKYAPGIFYHYSDRNEIYLVSHQYEMFDQLNAWKFDYRGLIPAGLAIDVNSLPENPYEK